MAKTGRPKAEEPKSSRVCVRFTEKEYEVIKTYADRCNMSIAQVLHDGALKQATKKVK